MTDRTPPVAALQRDFEWAINSPEPCALPDVLPWYDESAEFVRFLERVALYPLQITARARSRRLGKYFEALWHRYLSAHPDWLVRLSHYPIYDHKRTVGELDFVLENRNTGELLHLELAVKFFLYVPDISQIESTLTPTLTDLDRWVGPSLKDSLARKYRHLMQHQLPLGMHPAVKAALGRSPNQSQAVLKGRFFLPWRPDRPISQPQWLTWSDADTLPPETRVWPLQRGEWLTGPEPQAVSYCLSDWLLSLRAPTVPIPQPYMAWVQEGSQAKPVWRFIVPDGWPARARVMIDQSKAYAPSDRMSEQGVRAL